MKETSRDRILKTVNHKEPSELPVDLGSTPCTGITADALYDLNEYLGIDETVRIYDPMQWLSVPNDEVLEWVGTDAIATFLNGARPLPEESVGDVYEEYRRSEGKKYLKPKDVKIETDDDGNEYLFNVNGERMMKRSPNSYYFDDYPLDYTPLKNMDDMSEIEELPHSPLHREWTEADFERLEKNAKWLYENTDYALIASFGGSMFESPTHLRGYEQFLLDVKRNPDFVRGLERMLAEKYKSELEGFLDAIDDYVQIVMLADDMGSQENPLISPKDYEELIHPYMKEVYQYIKDNSDCYILRHSCGAIEPLLDYYIDLGVDILNPVQISAKGMEPEKLKEKYGDELTFWGGGADTQNILPKASPQKVKEHVKKNIEAFAPGGGYVFNQVHNIEPDVPPENIEAMYEAVHECQPYA
ncbi:hypothetical protein AKJ64_05005 [candidate division MSBL1 archaeon SCGC-AAA259E17]|uniref:Uroporphyrinogen decarboxylase (URO-D) domain-containing protein n=1 Tax=candidate division MSBL1 archaeon SCGC-AAA259E17 TaxID=1698263 RepID=A0A133UA41_9EURY|nr:hypothetical protein AKJ64_05005 [candidate division MSBL1 archaeon SCGC-AAA259E17]